MINLSFAAVLMNGIFFPIISKFMLRILPTSLRWAKWVISVAFSTSPQYQIFECDHFYTLDVRVSSNF